MKCSYCGHELRVGSVYCENCGKEAQIVPDYVPEEDPLYWVEKEEEERKQKEQEERDKKEEIIKNENKKDGIRKNRKKKIRLFFIILFVMVCVGTITGSFLVKGKRDNSYTYQMKKAYLYHDEGNYEKSLQYAKKAGDLNLEKRDPVYLIADNYYQMERYGECISVLEEAINKYSDKDGLNEGDVPILKFYELLLSAYGQNGDYDKIRNLAIENMDDEEVFKLADSYLTRPPEILPEGGTYNEALTVSITAPKNGYYIYYTIDGTEPDTASLRYTGPFELPEGKTMVSAVCADKKGNLSIPAQESYEVDLVAPDPPLVSPQSGLFHEKEEIIVTIPDGCRAYYTWDGSIPDDTSEETDGTIEMMEGNNILSVILLNENGLYSKVTTRSYTCVNKQYDFGTDKEGKEEKKKNR